VKRITMSVGLAVKLASIVVHADEYTDPNGLGHGYDKIALRQLIEDDEVLDWIGKLGPLAPVRRTPKKAKR